ncbi:non-ribosomal peptide synthase/polyketide synthase [Corallococcus sp. BB11-1]|uniref:non-ribosomal peptide synthase/polyketide synthase n=1 Tax=Corallococcus sp. BB11-1 TaxID=2996783 RepID=UPI00226E80F9|nr:non-ribosomal peptide synthase/polyketide synthase [Corallococcus sp. BB11-1]MCY1033947.1 non-ribosomal peptide synthase/polyketide synthase [Corallococcus sp. BB11-1]
MPVTLIDLLEERSTRRPDQRLYTFLEDDAEVPLTRGDLASRAHRIAAALQSLAPQGARAVLLYPPGADYLAGFFGCVCSGLVAVPAYPPDPSRLERTLPRLRALIADSGATVVLTTSVILSMAEFLFTDAPELRALKWVATDALEAGAEAAWKRPDVTADTLAFLQYTSGSTGTPRGVMLSHGNLLHNLDAIRHAFQTRDDSVGVIWLPPYHDMGLIGGVLVPLAQGFHTALMSPLSFLKRPRAWLEALTRFGGTISGGPNFAFELCVRRIPPAERQGLDLSRWEVAFCGAEPIRPDTLARFAEAFAPQGFRREAFYPCYGLAEATLIVSGGAKEAAPILRDVDASALEAGHAREPSRQARTLVGCGTTVAAQKLLVVEPDSGRVMEPGEVGEVWVKGPSVAQGYWRQPEESARVFGARIATGEGPFLRTGDLGFLDAGELYVTGRAKDLIILRGRNLYPQDLEAVVEESHPALRPGCGVAFGVQVDGEERLVVVQEVDPRKWDGEPAGLLGAIRQRLAEAHEVMPHAVVLIEPGSLPKTSSGKVQRRATRTAFLAGGLRELHAWRAPETAPAEPHAPAPGRASDVRAPEPRVEASRREAQEEKTGAPASELESRVLARVAARVGARVEDLDVHAPLTRYGLDSLAAVELAHALEQTLGAPVPMEALLRGASVAELVREATASVPAPRSAPVRVPRTESMPLSFAQERLWFLDRLEPGSAFYNVPIVSRLDGTLDVAALEQGLQFLVRRHEALRTVFVETRGEPGQRILPDLTLSLPVVDLASTPAEAREAEARRLADEEARRPFDLVRGPLLRVTLLRLDPARHWLLLTVHHLVADGWSLRVLLRELAEAYAALSTGRVPTLPELPLQYADHAAWQRSWLRGERQEDLLGWWRRKLAGAPPVLEFPGDRRRPRVQSYRGAQRTHRLEKAAWERVKALASREGTTPFVALLAGFQVLLHRYTGQEDVVVGVDTAHRVRPETAGIVGLFVNQLPLRGDLSGAPSFQELLHRSHRATLEAWAHQDLPFDAMVRGLNPERSLAHAPLFQVKLVLQDAASHPVHLPGLTLGSALGDTGATKLDLTLSVTDSGDGLELMCEYATDLFDADTIARMLGQLDTLLAGATAHPGQAITALPLLTPEDRRQVMEAWRPTGPAVAPDLAHRLFEAQARATPEAVAVALGEATLTYAQLDARANQLARHLIAMGVRPEQLVGVHLERTPDLAVALFGVLKAGGAFLMLDPGQPAARLEAMLREARVSVLLSQEALADRLASQGELLVVLDEARASLDALPALPPEPAPAVTPAHLAYAIFTSGSTGTPKGALLPHHGLCNTAIALRDALALRPGRRLLQLASIGFDASVCELFSTLLSGATLVFAPPESLLPGPPLQQVLVSERITTLTVTPTSLAPLEPSALPLLEVVASVGEACTPELASRWSPGRHFINAYGPTEVTICATVEPDVDTGRPSIGRAIPGVRMFVLDGRGEPVPVGVPGELYVGGVGVARGYLERPSLTAERFVPDPFSAGPGARLYRTGDMVRTLSNGRLEFLGRRDAQVKVHGIRVETGEVEAVLAQVPGVRQAVVLPREVAGETRLCAWVVAEESLELPAVRRFLKERLPDAFVPSSFVRMDALPLTPGGKLDRAALPAPGVPAATTDTPFAAPITETEQRIAEVWARVLDVPRVGLHAHFFEDLGGSSLLVVKASTQLREALGRDIPVTYFFEHPTVVQLAARLEREATATATAPRPAAPREASAQDSGDIALIGMAGRFPGAPDVHAFWRNLREGVESITRFTKEELESSPLLPDTLREHPDFVPAGGVLEEADGFDAAFFGLSPREAQWMDPQQRLFLQCAWNALEDAGYDAERIAEPVSLYAGAGSSSVHLLSLLGQTRKDPASMFEALGTTGGENVATKTAYKLKLGGESLNVYTACSTGLVTVHLACQSLRARQSDLALAGAVKVSLPQRTGYLFQEGMILSPDGHCRAFDAKARGTVLGSGLGVVVLKRLADAVRDGDRVYAVIKGSALNNDAAAKVSYTAPSVQGQTQVVARALAAAGVDADSVEYVEAHGTGTSLGDPIEVAALTRAYRAHTQRTGYCALGSVKTNIGHLDTAAGIAGLIKAALALHHAEVPPSLHFEQPNPEIDFARSPFFVNTTLRPWERTGGPRRAAVSSFGIGGTNAHVVLEEAPPREPASGEQRPRRSRQLVTLSARTPAALEAVTRALADAVEARADVDLADVAFTRNVGRKGFEVRRTVVAEDVTGLVEALRKPGTTSTVRDLDAPPSRRVAFLFPGQGAQSVGMARELFDTEPRFQEALESCLALLPSVGLKQDLRPVLFPPPGGEAGAEAALAEPRFALPALLAVEVSLARWWMGLGLKPTALLGHSFGEYAAACVAGVLSLEDALRLAVVRGELMSRLPSGGMLAVGMSAEDVRPLLSDTLEVAAVNDADRCTVSGPLEPLAALERTLAGRRVGVVRLPASHAFHSRAVEPLMPELERAVAGLSLKAPALPYVSSLTGAWIRPEEATSPSYWARQMREPVRFAAGLDTLLHSGHGLFIEAGPDQGLTALARLRLRTEQDTVAVPSLRRAGTSTSDAQTLLEAVGTLWRLGASVDWEALHAHGPRRRISLPGYPFETVRIAVDGRAVLPLPEVAPVSVAVAAPPAEAVAPVAVVPAPSGMSDIEQRLMELWRERLGITDIGLDDNFLDLGGNSLMAAQLLTRLRETFRTQVPLSDLFEAPTVAGLAERIEARLQAEGLLGAEEGEAPEAAAAIQPWPRTGTLPLSYVQERVWEMGAREPGSSLFNEPLAVRVSGALRPDLLERGVNEVIRRHESLRTVFVDVDGQGVPRLLPEVRITLPVVDLRGFAGDLEAEALRRARLEPAAPFELDRGPLVRVSLLRMADTEHVLLVTIHHIVADTLSLVNLIREALALYTGFVHGVPVPLPELSIQYIDFTLWQRQVLADGTLADQQAYWRRQLAGRPGALSLPLDRPRVPGARRRGARHAFTFTEELSVALNAFSQREGLTGYMTLLAGFTALLARCSGQEDIVVGTSIGNRTRPELEPQIGYVAHALALRTSAAGDPDFRTLALRVRDTTLSAFANPDVPYEQLLEELEPGEEGRLGRLFDAIFLLHAENVSAPIEDFPGLRLVYYDVTELPAQYGTSLADLTMLMREDARGFSGTLEYAVDLFDADTIARLLSQLQALLSDAVASPTKPLSRLSLDVMPVRARPTEAPVAEGGALPALLAARAERSPEAVAVRQDETVLTWRALREKAWALAERLRARGVGPGVPVAVCLEPSTERAVALWAVLASGGAYALVSPEGVGELASLGREGTPPLVVADAGFILPPGVSADVLRIEESLSGGGAQAQGAGVDVDALACLAREGADTTRPRVMLSHRNLVHRLAAMDARVEARPGELWLSTSDAAADPADLELLWALSRGLSVVLPSRVALRDAPRRGGTAAKRALDFSLFYFANDGEASGRKKYQLLIDGAKFADAHGFSAIWTPERHFHDFGGPYPSPTATSAALAMVTERVSIRAGSVVLPLHDPLRVAEEWSVIDNLSNGRAGVSFATGWNANDFVFAPQNFHQRPEAVRRGVEEVRALWKGGTVRRTNGAGVEVDVAIRPRPVQAELPVWITAAFNPETFRMAGELGTGLLTNVLGLGQDFVELERKVAIYREARRKAGHPGRGHVVLMLHTFVTASREDVKRQAREPLLRYFRSSVELVNGLVASQGPGFDVRSLTPQDLDVLLEQGVSRYLESGGLFGTPDSLTARVEQLRQADVDEVACLIDFGIAPEITLEGLRHLDVLRRQSQGDAAPAAATPHVEGDGAGMLARLLRTSPSAHLRGSFELARTLAELPDARSVLGPVRTLVLDDAEGLSADLAHALQRATSARIVSPVSLLPGAGEATAPGPRFVLDAAGRRAPVGVVGELFLGGDAVPLGFWKAPALTHERLPASPDGTGARLYGTGTQARYRADGEVELLTPARRAPPPSSAPTPGMNARPATTPEATVPKPAPLTGAPAPTPPAARAPLTPPPGPSARTPSPQGATARATPPTAPARAPAPAPETQAIQRVSRAGDLPLSFAQQRLWFLDQYEPGSALYNIPSAMRLEGTVDVSAMRRAFAEVMLRHEALHTTFQVRNGDPIQVISPTVDSALEVEDLSDRPPAEREAEAMRRAREEASAPFDLSRGPLLRTRLLRLSEREHLLLVTIHHIVSDGWSIGVLIREAVTLYEAFTSGRPSPLPALPIQYADFTVWQRDWLQGALLDKQLAYWRKQLEGAPPALELLTDHPRTGDTRNPGATHRELFPHALMQGLRALCRREKGTLFMGLLAGLQALLSRYTGQDDVSIGAPIAGRNHPQTEGLIGFFVNTLVLRTQLDGDPSFVELLRRVKAVTLGAYAHQDVPFEKLVEALQPPRMAGHTPFFQVTLVLLNTPVAELTGPGLTFRTLDVDSGASKFDFTLVFTETPRGLQVAFEYRSDLFEAATAARIMEHLRLLLEDAVAHPEHRLSELNLLSDAERQRVLMDWSAPPSQGPSEPPVHESFEAQARRTPDAVAALFEREALTYAELERRANQLAWHLLDSGVRPGDRVALCLEPSLELLVSVLAVLKSGAAVVPVDPDAPSEHLSFVLEDSGARGVLTQSRLLPRIPATQALSVCVDTEAGTFARLPSHAPPSATWPDSPCYLRHAPGTPGIVVAHRTLSSVVTWTRQRSSKLDAVTLQFASLDSDTAWQELFTAWTAGASVVVPPLEARQDLPALLALMARHGVERLFLPFMALQTMAELVAHGATVPRRLVEVVTDGEPLQVTPALVALFKRLPRGTLEHQYGPSEAQVVSAYRLRGPPDSWERLPPAGMPGPGTRLYVVDPTGRPCPTGVPGEVMVGGPQVALGYHARPGLTAERFVPDDLSGQAGARLFRTGDRARWRADGALELFGRFDRQERVRGFLIAADQVEAALREAPGVRAAAALVREDVPGDKRLVGYVVLQPDTAWDAEALRRALALRLPEYLLPTALVPLDALPLTPGGTLERGLLPAPDVEGPGETGSTSRPPTPLEQMLADLFAQVLGLEEVGITESFFDLGGHSLLATQVASRLRTSLGVDVRLREMFDNPTVEALARQIEDRVPEAARAPRAPAITARPGVTSAELSFAQQRLWFLDQYAPGSALYNMPAALSLEGTLNVSALTWAFTELVRRHQVLRTTFQVLDGTAAQVFAPPAPWRLSVESLEHLSPSEREDEAGRLAQEEARQPFDLARGPLLRTRLLRLAEREHLLLVTQHHIISDGWSIAVLVRELVTLYAARLADKPSPLPELPIQYADYAVWQREWLRGDALEAQVGYWRKQLEDAPSALELTTDHPRTPDTRNPGTWLGVELPLELMQSLRALCQQEGATLYMGLLAGLQALLARYSGQDDICVGAPVAGRTQAELEGLLGFFTSTLVLRTKLDGDPTFRELLGRVKDVTLGAYAHQDVPFEKLVETLQPPRMPGRTPFFQVALVMLNTPSLELTVPGVQIQHLELDSGTAKFDFTFTLRESPEGIVGALEYRTDLYEAATAERMVAHLHALLKDAVAHPEQRLSTLSLLSDDERHRVLVEWNATAAPYPRDTAVHALFEAQAARTPEAVAVEFQGRTLTYAALDRRANQLAWHLRKGGLAPGARVALCLERSLELPVAVLGILKAGAAYVPLDPEAPLERQAFFLEDTGAAWVLTSEAMKQHLPATAPRRLLLDAEAALLDAEPDTAPESPLGADALAYVLYTSGTTGRPKGVCVPHRAIVRLVMGTDFARFGPDEVFLQLAPLAFDASTFELWGCLLHGGRLVLAEPKATSLEELGRTLDAHHVTTLWLTSALFEQLAATEPEALARVRQVLAGGDVLNPVRVREHVARAGRLVNGYGPTEGTTFTTCHVMTDADAVETPVSIGRPIANTRVYVLDEHLRPVPPGVPGELYVAGDGLAWGYLQRPALTAERFLPDAFSDAPGARMYRAGDRARWRADGTLQFLGRRDAQVKLRGFRVEPGEIEAVLLGHASVREAVVLARDDMPGGRALVAYVVPRATTAPAQAGAPALLDVTALRGWLRERLPGYMVPSAIVLRASLPVTRNGKVDRRALPAPEVQGAEDGFVQPRTDTEARLATLWNELLGTKDTGAEDDFFDRGGHSLLATQLLSRIRATFAVEPRLQDLFEARTLEAQAAMLDATLARAVQLQAPPLRPMPRHGNLPLSFAQQRLWFLDQYQPGLPIYNIPAAMRLHGALDVTALERAFTELVRRHEALRTTFTTHAGTPVQVIAPASAFPLPVEELGTLPAKEREVAARRLAEEEARRPFDLARGPLLRARLLRLTQSEHVLLVTMHHIVSDGWSMALFVREMISRYAATLSGQPLALSPLPVQYADYAVWQRDWLQGDVLEAQLDYWRNQLAGAPASLALPTDRPRSPGSRQPGSSFQLRFPRKLAQDLTALCQQEGATLFMGLLAGFQAVLSRWAEQDDVSVGAPIAGRTRRETEGLIGFFVNTLVLRTRLGGDPTFRELLGRVKRVTLNAYDHQDVPFEKLVEVLQPKRQVEGTPFFQVSLVMLNTPAVELSLPGMRIEPLPVDAGTAMFDLSLTLTEKPEALEGTVEYRTDLYDRDTIERLMGHLRVFLEDAAAHPQRRLSELSLLTEAERRQVLDGWTRARADFPRDTSVHALFEAQVRKTPDAVAVEHDGRTVTYRELDARAAGLARRLRALGIPTGARVALLLERSHALPVALLGALKAGATYVPLDASAPPERLAFQLEDAGVTALLTEPRLRDRRPAFTGRVVDVGADLEATPEGAPLPDVPPELPAYVLYTSGSTGQPKGVLISHRALANHATWLGTTFALGAGDRQLQLAAPGFDASAAEVFSTLLSGATLVLAPPDAQRDSALLADTLSRQRITVLQAVPSVLRFLAVEPAFAKATHLRLLFCGGEALTPDLAARLRSVSPAVQLVNAYGPTEATIDATWSAVTGEESGMTVPIGRPVANAEAYVLDAALRPVPVGIPGELHLGGVPLAHGYLGRPALTAERFIPHPFATEPGARLYRSGDRARWLADGRLQFLGRLDHQVKLRGLRVEPGEVEAALVLHPGVREAAVVVHDGAAHGPVLVAYVVSRTPPPVEAEALRAFLRRTLPEALVPSAFVALETLPRTTSGKLDRRALPAPDLQRADLAVVAPRTDTEVRLAALWRDVLKQDDVGATDDFFARGGHSLLATQLLSRIRAAFQVELPLQALFEAPTLEGLAARIDAGTSSDSPLVMLRKGGGRTPFFCVHPVGGSVLGYLELARRMEPEQPFYGLQVPRDGAGTTVEAMATRYLGSMRGVQPVGPYRLGGWSMGGHIAYEMARQLHALGEAVEVLVVIDAMGDAPASAQPLTPDEALGQQVLEFAVHLSRLADVHPRAAEVLGLVDPVELRQVLEGAPDAGTSGGLEEAAREELRELWRRFKVNQGASSTYVPGPYDGALVLLRAEQGPEAPADLGWSALARGGVTVHSVPGDHYTLVRPPHVDALAERLRTLLAAPSKPDGSDD